MPPHSTHLIHVHRAYVSPHDLQIRFLFPSPSLIVLTESRRKLRTEITPRSEPSMMKSSRHGVIADWNTFAVEGSTCDSGSSGRIGAEDLAIIARQQQLEVLLLLLRAAAELADAIAESEELEMRREGRTNDLDDAVFLLNGFVH